MNWHDFFVWDKCTPGIPQNTLIWIGVISLVLCFVFLNFIMKKSISFSFFFSVAIVGFSLMFALLFFSSESILQSSVYSPAESALINLATAQEGYYLKYNSYADLANRQPLVTGEGWTSGPCVDVVILAADDDSWSATATRISSIYTFKTWTYDSSAGGLQR